MDSVKERIVGATGSAEQGQRATSGRTPSGTAGMPTGATAGYAPEVEGSFGREAQS
jgi:hypothetical protein